MSLNQTSVILRIMLPLQFNSASRSLYHMSNHLSKSKLSSTICYHQVNARKKSTSSDFNENIGPDYFLSKSLKELQLKEVFQNKHIVAVNKEQGTSVFGGVHGTPIADLLPHLGQRYNCEEAHLQVGISLKSYHSGLLILSKTEKVNAALKRYVTKSAAMRFPFISYLAITDGLPNCESREEQRVLLEKDYLFNTMMVKVVEAESKFKHKRGDHQVISVNYAIDLLDVNKDNGAALVQVVVDKERWACVECILSHHLSPVIGDEVYSSRVSTLMGVKMSVPVHQAVPGPQKLPLKIKKHIPKQDKLPGNRTRMMLHRHQMRLINFPSKNSKPLTLTAPPPPLFIETLTNLGLYREELFEPEIRSLSDT